MPGTVRSPVSGRDTSSSDGATTASHPAEPDAATLTPPHPDRCRRAATGILEIMFLVAHRTPRTAAGCEAFAAAGAGMFECDVQFRGRTVVVSHFLPFLGRRGWLEHDNGRVPLAQGRAAA